MADSLLADEEAPTRVFDSIEEVLAAAKGLQEEGWEIFPCDYPQEGGVGVHAWKYDLREQYGSRESTVDLVFYPLGKMKTSTQEVKYAKEFVDFLFSDGAFTCDNPKQLKLGAVKYDTSTGTADLRYLRISNLKNTMQDLPSDVKERLKTAAGRGEMVFQAERERIHQGLQALH